MSKDKKLGTLLDLQANINLMTTRKVKKKQKC